VLPGRDAVRVLAAPDGDPSLRVVLGRCFEVGIGVDPRHVALPGRTAALLAQVLSDGASQVGAANAVAFVARVDERRHVEDVLEALRVVRLQVAATSAVEAREAAGVSPRPILGTRLEVSVGLRGHGGKERIPFDTIRAHTRAKAAATVARWTRHARFCGA
jgi:hypothetical protein